MSPHGDTILQTSKGNTADSYGERTANRAKTSESVPLRGHFSVFLYRQLENRVKPGRKSLEIFAMT